jgi:hypothetical protein
LNAALHIEPLAKNLSVLRGLVLSELLLFVIALIGGDLGS